MSLQRACAEGINEEIREITTDTKRLCEIAEENPTVRMHDDKTGNDGAKTGWKNTEWERRTGLREVGCSGSANVRPADGSDGREK